MNVILNLENRVESSTSSKGNQVKWYKEGVWYKSDSLGYESLSEVVASRLLSYSNLTNYVIYEYCNIIEEDTGKTYKGCCSKDFLKSGESLITLDRVLLGVANKNFYQLCNGKSCEDSIKLVVDIVEKNLGVQDFGTWLSTLLKLDRIILNEDRHEHNIAFIRNNEGFSVSPIFDNGASFLSDTTFDYKLGTRPYIYVGKVKAKPFVSDFSKQVNSSDSYRRSNFKIEINKGDLPKLYDDLPYNEEIKGRVNYILKTQMDKYN